MLQSELTCIWSLTPETLMAACLRAVVSSVAHRLGEHKDGQVVVVVASMSPARLPSSDESLEAAP